MTLAGLLVSAFLPLAQLDTAQLAAPASIPRYDPAEFTVTIPQPRFDNPFVDLELTGRFTSGSQPPVTVAGFCDAADGGVVRLRFCPDRPGPYRWEIQLKTTTQTRSWSGELRCEPSDRPGPVIVDPGHPRHFIYAASGRPFYHLGHTAYHLLDTSNDDAQIDRMIDYCVGMGFNKIRFLLTGYPRDRQGPARADKHENGVIDPMRAPNYGATPGQVNALPAWPGEPHHHDFTRFNVAYWQKADRAVKRLRAAGIIATCIFTIEKQDLPREYGALTPAEYRLYRYAIARLAAFDNVWWDLGNEHNEYRDRKWGQTMGAFVKKEDPYARLLSAHAYQDFLYPRARWADFIITQQYGDERSVYGWVLKYAGVPKPYVNEEYGYENEGGRTQKREPNPPGHGQSTDWCRRCHWSIAMAGGYGTYGDSSGGVAYFYMGDPGPGKAAAQVGHLRRFFETLPFSELTPAPQLTSAGFCLARSPDCYVVYLPRGGAAELDLSGARAPLHAEWFDPRTAERKPGPAVEAAHLSITAPTPSDWTLLIRTRAATTTQAP